MAEKILHAVYDDDDKLLAAVKKIKAANYEIEEVYTPFPVHGLDKAMGLKETRIAITAFIYGLYWILFCNMDDESYYDIRLATKYWRKA